MPGFTMNLELDQAAAGIAAGSERGLRLAVEHLLTEANRNVPHDEGTLERSGEASVDGTRGAVSYDTPYAVRQHEDLSLHHDGKGHAKWLESAMTGETNTMGQIVAQAIRSELGT